MVAQLPLEELANRRVHARILRPLRTADEGRHPPQLRRPIVDDVLVEDEQPWLAARVNQAGLYMREPQPLRFLRAHPVAAGEGSNHSARVADAHDIAHGADEILPERDGEACP